jgi:hypothetical protein
MDKCMKLNIVVVMGVLNAHLCINALVQVQGKYGCEQNIDNFG